MASNLEEKNYPLLLLLIKAHEQEIESQSLQIHHININLIHPYLVSSLSLYLFNFSII